MRPPNFFYQEMVDRNAIEETFGDVDFDEMAWVFADYEATDGEIQQFFAYYGPVIEMNGFSPSKIYGKVKNAMEEL